MKKILLVKKAYRFFPIGLAHVITALRKRNIPYDLLDMDFENQNWKNRLKYGDYCSVGMGGLYADFNFIAQFSGEVKKIAPQMPFILGGNITRDIKKEVLFNNTAIDFAVVGEGEETLPELLHYIVSQSTPVEAIQGIVYRGANGEIVSTPRRKPINLKDEDSYPTWDDFNIDFYLTAGYPGYEKFTAMPVLTGRGCVGKCTFCSPTNGRYRMRPIQQVIDELLYLDKTYNFTGFAFLNEVMYPTEKMMLEFLEAYKNTGINKPWIACLRVDIGISLLREMKSAGCIGVNCGIESGSDRVLQEMRKNITISQVKSFYRNCKEVGLPAQGAIMFGSETESEEEVAQTIDLLIHEDIHSIGGTLLISYPGTEVYRRAVEQGRIDDEYTYLKNLDFSDVLTTGNFKNINYLNMSGMPDERLFKVAAQQSCRQLTYKYLKFSAKNIDLQNSTGQCSHCGKTISMPAIVPSILNCVSYCDACYYPVYFNILANPQNSQHLNYLKSRLAAVNKVAVYGAGENAKYLHLHDLLWLEQDKIKFVVDELGTWQKPFFFNAEVVNLQELINREFDVILLADTVSPTYAMTNLKNMGIPEQRIISLLPENWYSFLFDQYAYHHRELAAS